MTYWISGGKGSAISAILAHEHGLDFEMVFADTRKAQCSRILKTEPVMRFLDEHAAPDDPIVLGMDWSELDRIERAQKVWSPRPVVSLINEFKCQRPEWDKMLSRYFDYEPYLYQMGFPHNNCAGACVRGGLKQWATVLERMPDEYAKAEAGEKRVTDALGKRHTFLRKTWAGQEVGLTLEEFRVLYQAGTIQVDPYDYGGCGCFVDDEA